MIEVTYRDIIEVLEAELGSNWQDYFYAEFVYSLIPWESAFQYLVDRKKRGATFQDLAHDPIYGFWVNLADYHPKMENVANFFRTGKHFTITSY